MSNFLTMKELAAQLKVTKTTLFSLMKRGQFPAGIRIGRCRRWNIDEIDRWAEAQQEA